MTFMYIGTYRKMNCCSFLSTLTVILLLSSTIETATSSIEQNGNFAKETETERRRLMLEMGEAYPTGSRVPDCSHACGPCFPCRRVMVSYNCLLSESCPMSYRCMCHGRYYHIPSY